MRINTTLQVATVDDDVDEVNGLVTATITDGATHRVSESNRATVPVTDNDVRGVTVTPTALTVPEGDSASYTVVLDTEPTANVTVAVQVPEDAEVAVDETELTFTAENWRIPQTVTVTAVSRRRRRGRRSGGADPSRGPWRRLRHGNGRHPLTVTITENDTPTVCRSLTEQQRRGTKCDGVFTVTAERGQQPDSDSRVCDRRQHSDGGH